MSSTECSGLLSEHSVENMFLMSKIQCENKILFNCTLLCGY